MSEIYEAIQRMALDGMAVADVGTVESVDAEKGQCDVTIEGKAPAKGAWLTMGATDGGVMTVPEVGSGAVVLWVNAAMAVVVMVEKAERIVMRGGKRGGLVNVEDLVGRMNTLEDELNSLKNAMNGWVPVPQDGGAQLKAAVTGWCTSPVAKTKREDIEDELISH